MYSANPLDGDNAATSDDVSGDRNRIIIGGWLREGLWRNLDPCPRTAFEARYRFSSEATIRRIQVLALAFGTENKSSHRRGMAIVRKCLNHGESGSTRSAIGKWVAVTSPGPSEDFAYTFAADREVSWNDRRRGSSLA
jgi:hypothetical protein